MVQMVKYNERRRTGGFLVKDVKDVNEGLRFEKRAKRRKTNRVLNVLITIVVLLIGFFSWKLFFSNNTTSQPVASESKPAESTNDSNKNEVPINENDEQENQSQEVSEEEEDNDSETLESESKENETITDGDPESNIIRTIENSSWKPIGTHQSEPHTVVYDDGSVDRKEMERAVSYAIGIDQSNLIYWWFSRNGDNKVAATISTSDKTQVYRVYIDWIPEEGWKPVKIEELRENDAPSFQG